jgi:hypothetical protein
LQLNDLDNGNKKSAAENNDLLRQLEEIDQNVSLLQKLRHQLNNELEEVKKVCDDESKERQSLMGRFRNLEHEFDGEWRMGHGGGFLLPRAHHRPGGGADGQGESGQAVPEGGGRGEAQSWWCHPPCQANNWRLKFEKEGISRIEELESTKIKLQVGQMQRRKMSMTVIFRLDSLSVRSLWTTSTAS